jgi:hypothetical protein
VLLTVAGVLSAGRLDIWSGNNFDINRPRC